MRNTYALINLDYLKNNIEEIRKNYDYEYYFGVVKANAYGHGFDVVPTMEEAGINYFCVATLEEALIVRSFTKKPILCFGYVNTNDISKVMENDITLSIISYDYYEELKKVNPSIKVHLKINTGMNRFGIKDQDTLKKIIDDIKKTKMQLEGIYTHLATSGVSDVYYDKQMACFEDLTSVIDLSKIPIVHVFNSLGLARHNKLSFCNGVRLGLMMYGFTYNISLNKLTMLKRELFKKNISDVKLSNNLKLKKVLSLYSEVVNINKITKGEFVGYGAKYIAKKYEFIAVIPIGHADGITDIYKKVMINNKLYDIKAITMDYLMVVVDDTVKVHDKVALINDSLRIGREIVGDTPHHMLVSLSTRIERKYVGDKHE